MPEKSPETNRMMAKLEMMTPINVLFTPKVLAKIGMAGIISPNPTATRKEMVVSAETSRGSPLKGEVGLRMAIPAPRLRHPGARLRVGRYLGAVSP